MRIDCQSHVFPEGYIPYLERNNSPKARFTTNRKVIISFNDVYQMTINLEEFDPDRKIQDMDRTGIDIAVISCNMPGPCMLNPNLAVEAARVINNYIADIARIYRNRFVGLASIPWQVPDEAIKEIDRACDRLGLVGVMLFSHVAGKPIDDPSLEPIYKHLEMKGIPIVLHPNVPTWAYAVKEYSMIPMMALQVDTSFALLRLILSGTLEKHSTLKILMPHAGGILPYMLGRIEHQTEVLKRGRENISRPVRYYLKKIYYDTVSPSLETLKFCYEFVGADRLLFGTDHPWVDPAIFVSLIERMNLTEEDKFLIYETNAKEFFGFSKRT